ncbi:MAG: SDR family NAD(P)-dependent oxidoreductase [Spirochaetes bacterium]|nr:SDR family NAD(P)-dependent oxidoreductase [Spirochaetota bacterium]
MNILEGKKALVTGGAMGIGLATVKSLLALGCEVTIWDLNPEALTTAEKELRKPGYSLHCHVCDISIEKHVKESARKAEREMGKVDILVNNAGCVVAGKFCSQEPHVWDRVTSVNLNSMYYTISALLPGMYERNEGHIVNISSGAGLTGMPDLAVYCATKWAVYGLTESLRMEAMVEGKTGVKFSSIHPGILRHGMFEGSKFNLLGEILIPRVRNHDVIARLIVEKAIRKNRSMLMTPWSLHLGPVIRAFLPDTVLARILLMAGAGTSMNGWTGRKGSAHASPAH